MLDLHELFISAKEFADYQSTVNHAILLGITDGKAVGTYVEKLFEEHLVANYPDIAIGSSAKGIDLLDPRLNCDIKVTSIRQPQSSCPYRDARQKIYGLGYNLLLFVYHKKDSARECILDFKHIALIESDRTADYTLTKRIREMLEDDANEDDFVAYFEDRALPGDTITHTMLAKEVMRNPPSQGYLTISNALQWRLQYSRILGLSNHILGVSNYDRQ